MTDEPIAGYTVAAANVTARDVLDALTAGHEAVFYRAAIARDGVDAVAAQELADLIEGRHLFATEDEAGAEADDLIARDEFADPLVLTITADDIAEHLVRLGWTEPEPPRLFGLADDLGAAEAIDHAADALDLAHHDATPDALDALHRALLTLASAFEVTSPTDLRTVATRAALDAAAAVRGGARHEEAIAAAGHAVSTARAALTEA